jgi:hypothetical protein
MEQLGEGDYPEAGVIRVGRGKLTTHTPASLYEAWPPAEAPRIFQRLEFHYPPKHGRWRNRVDSELSALASPGLGRR